MAGATQVEDMWQPIETAPKDGTRIDLWLKVHPSPRSFGWGDAFRVPECWYDGSQWVHRERGDLAALYIPYITHWMPMPGPPIQ